MIGLRVQVGHGRPKIRKDGASRGTRLYWRNLLFGGLVSGWFGMGPMHGVWPFGVAGVIEFFGALALAFGLFTRPIAFLAAGETAVVYFWMHASKSGSTWPWVNHGEVPALYCFIFLLIWTSGCGRKTLDAW